MANMVRTTLSINDELRRDAMSLAAKRDVFYLSEVMREALALWIAREEMREEIEDNIDLMFSDEKDLDAGVDLAYKTYELMKAGK